MAKTDGHVSSRWMLLAIICYTIGAVLYLFIAHIHSEKVLRDEIDKRLILGASAANTIIPADYHDRIAKHEEIQPEEYRNVAHMLSQLSNDQGFAYIYTLYEKDGEPYFTMSSQQPDEFDSDPYEDYFLEYEEATPEMRAQFQRGPRILLETASDQWGVFRSAIIREVSPSGTVYLTGADYDVSYVDKLLLDNLLWSAAGALVLAVLSIPLLLAYRHTHRKEIEMLQEINLRLGHDLSEREAEGQRLAKQKNQLTNIVQRRTEDLIESEAKRQTSEQILSISFNNSPAPMSLLKLPQGTFVSVNPALEKITGFTANELEGHTPVALNILDKGIFNQLLQDAHQDSQPPAVECSILNRNQVKRICVISSHRFSLQSEDHLLAVWADVTENREMQSMLMHSERMAAVGIMAAGIAHEFNNALSGLIGFLDLIRSETELDSVNAQRMEIVCRSAERIASTTRQLLNFSRRDSSERSPCNLNDIVNEGLKLIDKDLRSSGIELQRQLSPLPQTMLARHPIEQVFLNIMINAQHALIKQPLRRITIATGQSGNFVYMRISDTGCGIAPENLQQIFLPFFTKKGEHADEDSPLQTVKGTGLGLSVSNQIIQSHGGRIEVNSALDMGTSMTVWLPITQITETDNENRSYDSGKRIRGAREIVYPPTIAIIDDEPSIRRFMASGLGQHGYPVRETDDGEELLKHIEEGEVDILLVDLQMPKISGEDILKEIEQLDPQKRPVCLVLTGHNYDECLDKLKDVDYYEILVKPCKIDHLRSILDDILNTPPEPAQNQE